MQISLTNIGKKYIKTWIFKGLTEAFYLNDCIAIIGSNGSGKSTLLKLISCAEIPSEGNITLKIGSRTVNADQAFNHVSFCGPYVDLPEELTLVELYDFHSQFSPLKVDYNSFSELVWLKKEDKKIIKYFSSGMKQRVKIALSLLSNKSLIFLDEPTSNLDEKGIRLFEHLLKENKQERIVFIGSNSNHSEIEQCNKVLNIQDYKS